MMTLGERLREARENKGHTQTYVAKALGLTSQAISNYERGERDPDTPLLKKLADFYEVSTDYLLEARHAVPVDSSQPKPLNTFPSTEPTPQELEELLRTSNVQFDGAPLDETDKEEVLEFLRYAWTKLRAKK